ncbi:DNA-directed RNA polymerase I subunit RPA34.5-domain-containing protein [Neohortaea acidophila]|uniref:DNA-directed RNA polymerase I subunit RPA34.5-domain-containing protein n=1 Tax=Neohortaea acidophila TaxID=245834 RepID=A0A6A6PNW2_9PEZI|nr:DNA-directed RNA polymerase I subunit RPA34.5-domain-containing protein [Neohortaea acidophila]KAF2481800.1 DNA-directed RNA polymerase I subunit RPA34.5-domain-containing protein [Neohortaea acidophila]
MAQPNDSRIERRLQRVVQHGLQNGETITVKTVRAQVEKELGLEAGFFKDHEAWKSKSMEIIQAAVEDAPERAHAATTKTSEPVKSKNKKGAAQTVDERDKDHPKHNAASTPAAKKQQQVAPSAVRADASVKGKSPAQVNGVKRKAASAEASSTGDSESDDDSSSSEEEPLQKKQKSSSGSESSESSSEDHSDSKDEGEKRKSASTAAPVHAIVAVPATPFTPPTGYTPLQPPQLAKDPAFSTADLERKQIWHFTAPTNVPLSSLQSFTLEAIHSGTSILSHNGADYALSENELGVTDAAALLLPTASGYQRVQLPVSRSLRIHQKITLPNFSKRQADASTPGSAAAGQIAQPAVSSVPAQPKGLRMRFKPPGFGAGRPGRIGSGSESTDDEDDVGPRKATLQFPRALGGHGTTTQQGANDIVRAAGDEEETGKKAKKKKKQKHGTSQGNDPDVTVSSKTTSASATVHDAKPVAEADKEPSKEEKAKRKEEKRLKKEQKRLARQTSE